MTETRTGLDRLRAGFPDDWISGDKTGTGIAKGASTYVDLAFGGPPGRAPLIAVAYFELAHPAPPMDPNATNALAQVGEVAVSLLGAPLKDPKRT